MSKTGQVAAAMKRNRPGRRRLIAAAVAAAFPLAAWSQTQSQQLERVEITGSAIKRIDAETSVPVTVLKVDDLKKEGIATVQQLLERVSAAQTSVATSQSVGSATGGAAFANLRALGQNKTLVLLNGRRIANNAIDGSAPDLNMIPFAALDRVEVLRDGASALYGSDAVGGVINFITKRDFTGIIISGGFDIPSQKAGRAENANIAFGTGDLEKDRFNFFGVVDYEKQDRIRAYERLQYDSSGKTSPSTFPGQYNQGGNVENPLFPDCASPNGIPNPSNQPGDKTCGYLFARQVDLIPNTERMSALLHGTFKITDTMQGNLEYFVTRGTNDTLVAGVPYGALQINPGTKYYPGNGITPLPTAFPLDPTYQGLAPLPTLGSGTPPVTQADIDKVVAANNSKIASNAKKGLLPGYVNLRWRDQASGGRAEQTENTQQRFVASLDGNLAGWDYKLGGAVNSNIIKDKLIGGYTDGTLITPAVLNGVINPFSLTQDAVGQAAIVNAAAKGTLFTGRGQVYSVDAQASRDIGDWTGAGRPAAIAVGAEFRHENLRFVGNPAFDTLVIASTGFDPATDSHGQRNVSAVFTELNVPILKQLDVTASLRYDRYSDFGSTTNPKVGFRYQPLQQLLVRGSYSTGFRAPSLFDLNAPNTFTNTANNHDDPIRCPGGNAIQGVSASDNCDVQFETLAGGNKALKPEKSKNLTFGLVFEPMTDVSLGVDFWWIKLRQQIGALTDDTIFGDPVKFASLYKRAPDGSLSSDGSLCPQFPPAPTDNCGYILDTLDNLGEIRTSGIDLTGNYRLRTTGAGNFGFGFNSTYIYKYEYQNQVGGAFINNIGSYQGNAVVAGGTPIFRWQTAINANWNLGSWGAGIVGHYKSGYADQDPSNHVSSYTTFDVYGTWQPTKAVSLTVGARNVFDRNAPFSNQAATFQVGYDPRFADPTGRTYYARGSYSF
jgi:iron complex outermembrane receptor protein